MINVGIIGLGRIGKVHCEAINCFVKNAIVKAVADPYLGEETIEWAKKIGIENICADYKKILEDKDIDAVLICSSTDTHSHIALEAIRANKHIFCEKPIDHDVEKIKKVMAELEKNPKIKFQVGFNRRFDHNFAAVKEAVQKGEIGDLNILKITSRDPAAPPLDYIKVSGGIFLDMTIHDFDMIRFISGSEVEEVFAMGGALVDERIAQAGDIDTAVITMKLENGAFAVVDNCRRTAYGYDQRLEAFGSKGQACILNDTKSTLRLTNQNGETSEKPLYFFLERYTRAYVDEILEFIQAIEEDKPVPVGVKDGLEPVIIALSAKKSLEEGRKVSVKEIKAEYNL
ncbi:MAG: inositol 2-dehydrogenase [Bacillota bacterium]|jgi:myo-inositol 2-dehydrogenase/D-chiro-inositol 1-dehydrogenase|nr:inositol 2-dehydrogenase [Bacillota bacterium]HHU43950.1 inositol 2-dehydrogenase [Clostridiales bacterium]